MIDHVMPVRSLTFSSDSKVCLKTNHYLKGAKGHFLMREKPKGLAAVPLFSDVLNDNVAALVFITIIIIIKRAHAT